MLPGPEIRPQHLRKDKTAVVDQASKAVCLTLKKVRKVWFSGKWKEGRLFGSLAKDKAVVSPSFFAFLA
jgi:hypothetical protein